MQKHKNKKFKIKLKKSSSNMAFFFKESFYFLFVFIMHMGKRMVFDIEFIILLFKYRKHYHIVYLTRLLFSQNFIVM